MRRGIFQKFFVDLSLDYNCQVGKMGALGYLSDRLSGSQKIFERNLAPSGIMLTLWLLVLLVNLGYYRKSEIIFAEKTYSKFPGRKFARLRDNILHENIIIGKVLKILRTNDYNH